MQSFWILNTGIIQLSKFSLDLCIFDGILIILDSRDPKFSFNCDLIAIDLLFHYSNAIFLDPQHWNYPIIKV